MTLAPLSWAELEALAPAPPDPIQGPTNSQSRLRLFGQPESAVRVTLYRDHHAWCPYCQKIWLWLEEKQIPYRVAKVTMFCYGQKESWYKQKVPSGMLPAVELDGTLITESDDILLALEQAFGPLGAGMTDPQVMALRRLERRLFRVWCQWLCTPNRFPGQDQRNKSQFDLVMGDVESALAASHGPYFLGEFTTADVIFVPYVERMNASLYYYKGYSIREEYSALGTWFNGLEQRSTYRGTQSDFHTHAHDLPPQMGGCWANTDLQTHINQNRVDQGPWFGLPDVVYGEPENARGEALYRVLKHRHNIIRVNPMEDALMEKALRCALTTLMQGELCYPPEGSAPGLRYLRDRVSVPRDMSIYAAKYFRQALEETAALVGVDQGVPLGTRDRQDQNPANFQDKTP